MIKKIFLIILYFSFYKEIIIQDAIYNLIYDEFLFFYYNYDYIRIEIANSFQAKSNCNFKINRLLDSNNLTFYYIEHTKTNFKVSCCENKEITLLFDFEYDKKDFSLWTFLSIKNNTFIIQNKYYNCFIIVRNFTVYCENISLNMASKFNLLKIYEEVKETDSHNQIIDEEPIDVLIKYIDLNDPFLNRTGIHQIKKDYENEELRYAVRSVLKYIPWVRKIFILMPNEKVRYFKDQNIIKDKIVYIKDKDLLGHDSANSLAFQFRYWKMKKFGISDNFITMDDDYFIGSPLKKSDFFYLENGKVIPAIISPNFLSINITKAQRKLNKLLKMILNNKNDQSSAMFEYSLHLTYFFFIKLFNKPIIVPKYTHNAFPVNLNELKECYDLIYNSQYRSSTLDSLFRHLNSFQFQAFIFAYTFLKYNKKVKIVSYKYMNTKNSYIDNYNYSLLCINTGSLNYSNLIFLKSRLVMEYLFHEKTPYEIINYSLYNITFDILWLIEKKINHYKNKSNVQLNDLKNKLEYFEKYKNKLYIIFFLLTIFLIFLYIIYKVIFILKNIKL